MATGSTMRAAVEALRRLDPVRIIVAVPTAAPDVCANPRHCRRLHLRVDAHSVFRCRAWYDNFSQTTDEQVRDLLEKAAVASAAS